MNESRVPCLFVESNCLSKHENRGEFDGQDDPLGEEYCGVLQGSAKSEKTFTNPFPKVAGAELIGRRGDIDVQRWGLGKQLRGVGKEGFSGDFLGLLGEISGCRFRFWENKSKPQHKSPSPNTLLTKRWSRGVSLSLGNSDSFPFKLPSSPAVTLLCNTRCLGFSGEARRGAAVRSEPTTRYWASPPICRKLKEEGKEMAKGNPQLSTAVFLPIYIQT
ncbi:unnamed protein product [Linum trigynum]|uniref:Uncharacterized protein n=1 Tax=Linum trigynum TaxID=586398 RepID=A0AAV2CWL3_9ROSI